MSSPRTPVRRRLFPSIAQAIEEGQIDNVVNVLQEEIRRDRSEASIRWGFDFEHERPIAGGPYHWIRIDSNGQEEDIEEDSEELTVEGALQSTTDVAADFDPGTALIGSDTIKESNDHNENLVQTNSTALTKDKE